ncbi:MAG: helix-turn-helix domain-containing protein [Bacteroidales bacterium]|jgi:transcriptional regulator with XRE-family HTH domain|nr:helix-turn-helix domain-containing protein [Bacteroidales bacterium]
MNETNAQFPSNVHHGHNIKKLRDILGIKQEYLANELNMTQQAVSKLEQKEKIDDETLEKVASILKIPPEAIKGMTDEAAFNIIANSYHDNASTISYGCHFNPMDKIVELYERLLSIEKEKVDMLQEMLKEK